MRNALVPSEGIVCPLVSALMSVPFREWDADVKDQQIAKQVNAAVSLITNSVSLESALDALVSTMFQKRTTVPMTKF